MDRVKAVKCNKCNDILYTNRLCSCGHIGFLKDDRFHFIYCDKDEDFDIVEAYIDTKLVKFKSDITYILAPILYMSKEVVNDII